MSLRYKDISYSLFQRKRRKTRKHPCRAGWGRLRDCPDTLTTKEIERLIETKRRWIYRQLAEWADLNATRVKREFVNGEGFLYPRAVIPAKNGSGPGKAPFVKGRVFLP